MKPIAFSNISMNNVSQVGGKNASLGEMTAALTPLGVRIPDGFALTVEAYYPFLSANNLDEVLCEQLGRLDRTSLNNLHEISHACRSLILSGHMPEMIEKEIGDAFGELSMTSTNPTVAVRSSHASIIARELGIPAVVGSLNATEKLTDDQMLIISACAPKAQHWIKQRRGAGHV